MRIGHVLAVPAVSALLAGTVACGDEHVPDPVSGIETVNLDGVARAPAGRDAPVARTVAGANRFGAELVGRLDDGNGPTNVVVSPLSVAYAFGMLRAGAAGESRRQLDETFGFPEGGPDRAFNASSRRLVSTDGPPAPAEEKRDQDQDPPEPTVAIANGLFVDDEVEPAEDFLRVLAKQYGAGVQRLDLDDPAGLDQINRWVSEQTADRIPSLFDELESEDPALVLANAIYLKAEWASTFSEGDTTEAAFHAPEEEVRVATMRQQGSFGYVEGDGYRAVELPYAGGELAMRILLPDDDGEGGPAPAALLTPEVSDEVATELRSRQVDLSMPRFDFSSDADLTTVLGKLGLDLETIDLSGIAANLEVTQAVHRANITVDEQGTEAAAVTGIEVGVNSAPAPEDPVRMRVDRPFAFTIVHTETNTPLFLGQVADPARG